IKLFPLEADERDFPNLRSEMERRLHKLGKVSEEEWHTLAILVVIVTLWLTEAIHGLNPTVIVILGVVLMALPKLANGSNWERSVSMNYNTVILLRGTLS